MKKENKNVVRAAGGILHEFQQFALKGNVVDLAVAVVIGNAVSQNVNALVGDIIAPTR